MLLSPNSLEYFNTMQRHPKTSLALKLFTRTSHGDSSVNITHLSEMPRN